MADEKRLIDANALAKDLELLAKYEDCFRQSVILGVVHTVKAQPTVDAVEVVHGRWKPVYTCSGERLWGYNCDRCKLDSPTQSKFCPNCGAKMDGDGNA